MGLMSALMHRQMSSSQSFEASSALICRGMTEADINNAVTLLAAGFPARSANYWRRGLHRLRDRSVPDGMPRYGYVLLDGDRLVGILLLLFTTTDSGGVRGNVSSWFVEPAYRSISHLLLSTSLKLDAVTLYNVSPAPETIETIGAQGFVEYAGGAVLALPALAPPVFGARVRRVTAETPSALLADHAALGCLCFEVIHQGKSFPFVFQPRHEVGGKLPAAQLIYCRDVVDLVRYAGPLGRRLLRHGLPVVLIDANGPIDGLPGWYRPGRGRRFYRGYEAPRLGDLAYSELVVFGP